MKKVGILLAVIGFLAALAFFGIQYYEASQFEIEVPVTQPEVVHVIEEIPAITVGPTPTMVDEEGQILSHPDNAIYNLDKN